MVSRHELNGDAHTEDRKTTGVPKRENADQCENSEGDSQGLTFVASIRHFWRRSDVEGGSENELH